MAQFTSKVWMSAGPLKIGSERADGSQKAFLAGLLLSKVLNEDLLSCV